MPSLSTENGQSLRVSTCEWSVKCVVFLLGNVKIIQFQWHKNSENIFSSKIILEIFFFFWRDLKSAKEKKHWCSDILN